MSVGASKTTILMALKSSLAGFHSAQLIPHPSYLPRGLDVLPLVILFLGRECNRGPEDPPVELTHHCAVPCNT